MSFFIATVVGVSKLSLITVISVGSLNFIIDKLPLFSTTNKLFLSIVFIPSGAFKGRGNVILEKLLGAPFSLTLIIIGTTTPKNS